MADRTFAQAKLADSRGHLLEGFLPESHSYQGAGGLSASGGSSVAWDEAVRNVAVRGSADGALRELASQKRRNGLTASVLRLTNRLEKPTAGGATTARPRMLVREQLRGHMLAQHDPRGRVPAIQIEPQLWASGLLCALRCGIGRRLSRRTACLVVRLRYIRVPGVVAVPVCLRSAAIRLSVMGPQTLPSHYQGRGDEEG
jgi:hypothetical protein